MQYVAWGSQPVLGNWAVCRDEMHLLQDSRNSRQQTSPVFDVSVVCPRHSVASLRACNRRRQRACYIQRRRCLRHCTASIFLSLLLSLHRYVLRYYVRPSVSPCVRHKSVFYRNG